MSGQVSGGLDFSMRFAALVLLVTLAVLPAAAQEPPRETWRVTGVAPDDVLNIRETPDPNAPILGRIPPDARGIRGFGCEDAGPGGQEWCRVKYGDAVGWVRGRYLSPD